MHIKNFIAVFLSSSFVVLFSFPLSVIISFAAEEEEEERHRQSRKPFRRRAGASSGLKEHNRVHDIAKGHASKEESAEEILPSTALIIHPTQGRHPAKRYPIGGGVLRKQTQVVPYFPGVWGDTSRKEIGGGATTISSSSGPLDTIQRQLLDAYGRVTHYGDERDLYYGLSEQFFYTCHLDLSERFLRLQFARRNNLAIPLTTLDDLRDRMYLLYRDKFYTQVPDLTSSWLRSEEESRAYRSLELLKTLGNAKEYEVEKRLTDEFNLAWDSNDTEYKFFRDRLFDLTLQEGTNKEILREVCAYKARQNLFNQDFKALKKHTQRVESFRKRPILNIPADNIQLICNHLTLHDMYRLMRSCKHLFRIILKRFLGDTMNWWNLNALRNSIIFPREAHDASVITLNGREALETWDFESLVEKNPNLSHLGMAAVSFIRENPILFSKGVARLKHLKSIDLSGSLARGSSSPSLELIENGLSNGRLISLDVSNNQLSFEDAKVLWRIIIANPLLKYLNVANCCLDEQSVGILAHAIASTKIDSLDLSRNKLSVKSVNTLAEVISHMEIHRLRLRGALPTHGSLQRAFTLLPKIRSLRDLDISENLFKQEKVPVVSTVLNLTRGLRHLPVLGIAWAAHEAATFRLVQALVEGIYKLPDLQRLCLNHCGIGNWELQVALESMRRAAPPLPLHSLHFTGNPITYAGTKSSLFGMLRFFPHLQHLEMKSNIPEGLLLKLLERFKSIAPELKVDIGDY